jgi:hypothetical protein
MAKGLLHDNIPSPLLFRSAHTSAHHVFIIAVSQNPFRLGRHENFAFSRSNRRIGKVAAADPAVIGREGRPCALPAGSFCGHRQSPAKKAVDRLSAKPTMAAYSSSTDPFPKKLFHGIGLSKMEHILALGVYERAKGRLRHSFR